MSVLESEAAIQALETLTNTPPEDVVLTFREREGLITAKWAMENFGGRVLGERVIQDYEEHPELDSDGEAIHPSDLTGNKLYKLRLREEDADTDRQHIQQDLEGAINRVGNRGYNLGQVAFHGAFDASAIIGTLERAASANLNPENFTTADKDQQKAARYILDHLQVQTTHDDDGVVRSQSYLL